jgi:hypothetical protein
MPSFPLPSPETLKAVAEHRRKYFHAVLSSDMTSLSCASLDADKRKPTTSNAAESIYHDDEPQPSTSSMSTNNTFEKRTMEANGSDTIAVVDLSQKKRVELTNVNVIADGEGYLAITCVCDGREYTGVLMANSE